MLGLYIRNLTATSPFDPSIVEHPSEPHPTSFRGSNPNELSVVRMAIYLIRLVKDAELL